MTGLFARLTGGAHAPAIARFVAMQPLRWARGLPLHWSLFGLTAVLLANWIRIYLPGAATDWLFAATVAAVGLSLVGRPVRTGARATAICLAAVIAVAAALLVLDPGIAELRNFFGFPIAAILFLYAYRHSSEWLDSNWTIWVFLTALFTLFPLYFTSSGINANVFSGILAYLLLSIGLLSSVTADGGKTQSMKATGFFVSIIAIGIVFGSRSIILAGLAAGIAYGLAGAFLRTALGAALATVALTLSIVGITAFWGLPQLMGIATGLDRAIHAGTGLSLNTGRHGIWPMALAGIDNALWLGHGLGASVGDAVIAPEPADAAASVSESVSCLSGTNPRLFDDCHALIELRGVLPDHESALWTWDFGNPIDSWAGVSLGGAPTRVVGLDLTGMRWRGGVPLALTRLDKLARLRLGDNRFEGPIPAELGRLENLRELALDGNLLEGVVPESLGRLAALRELGLANNRLTGSVPGTLGELRFLSTLRLAGNDFERPFPAALYEAADHDLFDNLFCLPSTGLDPALFDDCSSLIDASGALGGVGGVAPNWRIDVPLKEWQGVDFAGDRIIAVDLEGRGLTGVVPEAFGGSTELEVLRLGRNQLAGAIPESLANLRRLRVLDLGDNRLDGAIPEALGDLPALAFLRLGGNRFARCPPPALYAVADHDLDRAAPCVGEIADGPGLAADADALLAMRDILAGDAALDWSRDLPVPAWRGVTVGGAPPRVVGLTLTRAGLNGRIPPGLGSLTRLVALRLDGNRLDGPIPGELGGLADLRELALQNNELTGAIPASLGALRRLSRLRLGGNDLSETLPPGLCAVPDRDFDPQRVCAPSTADAEPNMRTAGNKAVDSGDLPQAAPGARPAALSGRADAAQPATLCRTSDTTPMLLDDCKALLRARDRLVGAGRLNWRADMPIERWRGVTVAGDPPRAIALELRDAELDGTLPPELGALSALRVLALDGNALQGAVPAALGGLRALETLRLDRNRLTGRLPAQLGALAGLSVLRLGGNDFSGCPPPALRRVADHDLDDALCLPLPDDSAGLAADAALLLTMRDSLTGDAAALDWSRETPVNEWGGVTVAGAPPRVVALNLSGAGLEGSLPPELAGLDGLVELRLGDNRLTGPIPAELGSLSRLTVLALDDNRLQGAIPGELAALAGLSVLRLGGNRLEGCPPPALRANAGIDMPCLPLGAHRRALAGDAEALLSARDALAGSASLNWSEDIPVDAWRGVSVSGAPPRVTALDLADAGLDGRIPAGIASLDALAILRLDGNALTGPVPEALAESERLVELGLEGNALSNPPPSRRRARAAFPAAPRFCRAAAGIGGGLLADCSVLLAMRDALAGAVALNWSRGRPLPEWQGVRVSGAPPRVTALALPGMGLSGVLPPELGRLGRLASLRLEDNQLAGEIPAGLGNLEFLEELDLSNNRLSGPLPQSLFALERLSRLEVGDNDFIRCPQISGNARALRDGLFCMSVDNGLSRSPGDLAAAMPLRVDATGLVADAALLAAARDALAGSVALDWSPRVPVGAWRGVATGGVPPRVIALDLSHTGLDGRIPPELGGLTRLVALRLDGNRLSGPVPPELGGLRDLRELALQGNELSGPVPRELARLRYLRSLRLDDNNLSGRIPAGLGGLERLSVLRLEGNRLFGPTVPAGVASAAADEEDRGRAEVADLFCSEADAFPGAGAVFADCRILLDARDTLAGAAEALDWSEPLPLASWRGVELGGAPTRVVALHLPGAGLTGSLPAELGALDGLVSLRLENNALGGSIPPELGNLDRLQVLKLAGNRFSGCLPSEAEALGGGSARALGLPPCLPSAADGMFLRNIIESITNFVDPETRRTTYISAHNQYLQTLFQTGIVGLAPLVALCISLVFNLRAPGGVLSIHRYAFACVVFVLVHSTFEVFLFRVNMATLAWLLLGAGAAAAARASARRGDGARPAPA